MKSRAAPLVRRLAATVLARAALDPTHPAVVAVAGLLARPPLIALAPGLAAFTAADRSTARTGTDGASPLAAVDRSVLTIAHACAAVGNLHRAEALLTAHAEKNGRLTHPRILERLAEVHLASGSRERAEAALAAALRLHASDARLHLALIDVYLRTGQWAKAVKQWEQTRDEVKAAAEPARKARIASAYRRTGRLHDAFTLATEAAQGSASDEIQQELELCRRLCVDWSRSLASIDTPPTPSPGRVEDWGFLLGGHQPLKGKLRGASAAPREIHLKVNGFSVATTQAAASIANNEPQFAINCAELLHYLGEGDIVEITAAHERLELPSGSTAVQVRNGLPSRFRELRSKIEKGFVFNKLGRLIPGHTAESKRDILDFYAEVADFLESRTRLPVFPFYGNLLGAIREQDFISHDADGFDMLVLCEGRTSAEVKTELGKIYGLLQERGYSLELRPWAIYVRRHPKAPVLLDLSYGWLNEADELNISFGWHHAPARGRSGLTEKRLCRIADRWVKVPGNAERILEQLYGPTWRVPNQGYAPLAGLKRDERYLLTERERAIIQGKQADTADESRPRHRDTAARIMKRLPIAHVEALFCREDKYASYRLISLYSAIPHIELPGDYAEFGVYKGDSARFLSHFVPLASGRTLHLFDSFEGLPEDWFGRWKKGHFDLQGDVPEFDSEIIRIHKGWFKDTVPPFAETLEQPLAFIHMDADLYASTREALDPLNLKIAPGTVIVFDEYFMQGNDDEHRALWDWAEEHDRRFDFLWRTRHSQVAIQITR